MSFVALAVHFANFVLPALLVAAVLQLFAGLGRQRARAAWVREFGWIAGAGVLVLLAGLVVFGRDGKMLTYTALVLAQGSLVWWRRGR